MKLNNKGWGVFQMAWMTGIILFFFLLVIVLIYRFYKDMGYKLVDNEVVVDRSHEEMIDDLNDAATKYIDYYYANINNLSEIKLTSYKLFQVGLFAKDLYGDCTGYALVKKSNGLVNSESFIKCDDYKSPGYEEH